MSIEKIKWKIYKSGALQKCNAPLLRSYGLLARHNT